jgi:hypothetical protein
MLPSLDKIRQPLISRKFWCWRLISMSLAGLAPFWPLVGDNFGIGRHFHCLILAAPCSASCDTNPQWAFDLVATSALQWLPMSDIEDGGQYQRSLRLAASFLNQNGLDHSTARLEQMISSVHLWGVDENIYIWRYVTWQHYFGTNLKKMAILGLNEFKKSEVAEYPDTPTTRWFPFCV